MAKRACKHCNKCLYFKSKDKRNLTNQNQYISNDFRNSICIQVLLIFDSFLPVSPRYPLITCLPLFSTEWQCFFFRYCVSIGISHQVHRVTRFEISYVPPVTNVVSEWKWNSSAAVPKGKETFPLRAPRTHSKCFKAHAKKNNNNYIYLQWPNPTWAKNLLALSICK